MTRSANFALAFFLLVVSTTAYAKGTKVQGGYSTAPLERAVFDSAHAAVGTAFFNEWLIINHQSLDDTSMKGPREHLYYLIDSWVKNLYDREQVVLPEEHDLILERLFAWSERLGVYGGHLVYDEIKREDAPPMPALTPVPKGFELELRDDMLVLSAEDWSVAVPYYFMIWHINEFDAKNGPHTQMVILSTGAAAHEGVEGHSQATITLCFGPGLEGPEFARYWEGLFGFTGEEPEVQTPSQPRSTRRRYDERQKLHFEVATWGSSTGQLAVFYGGINGTYQWNRPHFFDFLQAIQETKREPSPEDTFVSSALGTQGRISGSR